MGARYGIARMIVAILLGALHEGALAVDELSLPEFLQQVESANPELKASAFRARSLQRLVRPARTIDDPFFAVGPDEKPTDGGTGGMTRFQVSQTLPFPGKLGAKGDATEARAEAAQADTSTTKRRLKVISTQSYFLALYNQKALEINRRTRQLVSETAASQSARYKTGGASHHEWLLARIESSLLDVEARRLKREQAVLRARMNELRNQPPEMPLGGLAATFTVDEKIEITKASTNSFELLSSDFALKASREDKRLARLSYFPDLVLQGMYMKPAMGSESMAAEPDKYGFMVGFSLPLFFFRKQSEISASAEAQAAAVEVEREGLRLRLRTEEIEAREQLASALDTRDLYEKDVIPMTELAVRTARSEYAARRLPLTTYLEALRIQSTQEIEYFAIRIDVELARLRINEPLAEPPLLRLAPQRPSLVGAIGMGAGGGESMSGGMQGSDSVNMGRGMKLPPRKQTSPATSAPGESSGMEGM